jgi:hypothetical protein
VGKSSLTQTFKDLFEIIVISNPCKKCIVKMICTEECETLRNFRIKTGDIPYFIKFCLFMIVASIFVMSYTVYTTIINILKYYSN